MRILRAAANIAGSALRRYRLLHYDDFTIADYFRGQGARIGADCRILIRDLGSEPYLVHIGNHCTIAGNVVFITHDGAAWVFTGEQPNLQRFGTIEILDNCFIGHGTIIMPNIRIGPDSIVGAGAVVTKHVPPNTVVAGNPAKPICTLEEYKKKAFTTWRWQKPPGYLADLRHGVRYAPSYIQKQKEGSAVLLREHLQHLLWEPSPHHDSRPDQASQAPPFPTLPSATTTTRDRRFTVLAGDDVADRSRPSE